MLDCARERDDDDTHKTHVCWVCVQPAMGVEFQVVPGKGPQIAEPIRSLADVERLAPISHAEKQLPFVKTILSSIRGEIDDDTTLLGFIGTPWTLCAYSVEGAAEKNCMATKTLMFSNPEVVKGVLEHYTQAITEYACYQIESGAQVCRNMCIANVCCPPSEALAELLLFGSECVLVKADDSAV